MNPINLLPKSFSQLSLPTNLHKLSQIRIASTQLIHHRTRKYSSDDQPPEKPPPEFPAAPQPDKPSESSEVPSAPTPKTQYRGDPYGSGAAIPQQSSKSKVRQPHGAEVKNPVPPESDDMVSY